MFVTMVFHHQSDVFFSYCMVGSSNTILLCFLFSFFVLTMITACKYFQCSWRWYFTIKVMYLHLCRIAWLDRLTQICFVFCLIRLTQHSFFFPGCFVFVWTVQHNIPFFVFLVEPSNMVFPFSEQYRMEEVCIFKAVQACHW